MKGPITKISNLPRASSSLPPFDNSLTPVLVELHFAIRNERKDVNGLMDSWNGYLLLDSNGHYMHQPNQPAAICFIADHVVIQMNGKIGYRPGDPKGSFNEIPQRFHLSLESLFDFQYAHLPLLPDPDLDPVLTQWDIKLHKHTPLHPDSLTAYEHTKYQSQKLLFTENASMGGIYSEEKWSSQTQKMEEVKASNRMRMNEIALEYQEASRQGC